MSESGNEEVTTTSAECGDVISESLETVKDAYEQVTKINAATESAASQILNTCEELTEGNSKTNAESENAPTEALEVNEKAAEDTTEPTVATEENAVQRDSTELQTEPKVLLKVEDRKQVESTLSISENASSAAEHEAPLADEINTKDAAEKTTKTDLKSMEHKSAAAERKPLKEEPTAELNGTATPAADQSSKCDNDEYAEHVTYTEDGSAIYTDPKTSYKYKWSTTASSWEPCESSVQPSTDTSAAANPYENEHYKWCSETQQWKPKVQAAETEHYKWDAEKHEWIAKTAETDAAKSTTVQTSDTAGMTYEIDADGQRTYTDKDGTVFFWDAAKSAWFPKIDDDFMARYQMSYGFIDNTSAAEEEKRRKEEEEEQRKEEQLKCMAEEAKVSAAETDSAIAAGAAGVKRKATQEPPKWFEPDQQHNTKVYVSNLPQDITLDEFAEVMGKCGMIMRDPQTQKFKLKLYTEADGQIKGDGLCDYIKVESVDLALNILDEYNLRGHKIRVQRAKFEMRGEYNPALKPKRKKKDKEKLQKMKEKLFDWRPEKMRGERTKNEKVVIIKNLFQPEIFEKEVQLILEYQNDLREECGKCGTVRKIVIYDRHAEGVAQVNMATPEEADLVIQMMHGRFFGKRQLTADHWDGKTKYKVAESESDVQQRLTKWDQFLETDEGKHQVADVQSSQTPEQPSADTDAKVTS